MMRFFIGLLSMATMTASATVYAAISDGAFDCVNLQNSKNIITVNLADNAHVGFVIYNRPAAKNQLAMAIQTSSSTGEIIYNEFQDANGNPDASFSSMQIKFDDKGDVTEVNVTDSQFGLRRFTTCRKQSN